MVCYRFTFLPIEVGISYYYNNIREMMIYPIYLENPEGNGDI